MRLFLLYKESSYKVSIHASVKDATLFDNKIKLSNAVSIHASVKDATKVKNLTFSKSWVSIHASVKDATSLARLAACSALFQSTHL